MGNNKRLLTAGGAASVTVCVCVRTNTFMLLMQTYWDKLIFNTLFYFINKDTLKNMFYFFIPVHFWHKISTIENFPLPNYIHLIHFIQFIENQICYLWFVKHIT